MKYYISGQITGCKDYMERFEAAEAYLKNQVSNALVFNPAKINSNMPKGSEYEDYMAVAMAILERCDNIYMLPGWEKSPGANREYGYAQARDGLWTYELTEENLEEGRTILKRQMERESEFPKDVYMVQRGSKPSYFVASVKVDSAESFDIFKNDQNFKNKIFEVRAEAEEAAKELNHE